MDDFTSLNASIFCLPASSNDERLRELALFAGAGGGILASTLLGWRTVCAVEIDSYAAGILVARQNEGILEAFPIWDDVRTFDGRPWQGRVDVVSGGFPCQDISVAGKGAGITGKRSGLWSDMARIIGEVRPRYAFIENSPALVKRGLDRVLSDLAALRYDAQWLMLSAAQVGAPHKRERLWLLAADAGRERCKLWSSDQSDRLLLHDVDWDASESEQKRQKCQCGVSPSRSDVANPIGEQTHNIGGIDQQRWDNVARGIQTPQPENSQTSSNSPSRCSDHSNVANANGTQCQGEQFTERTQASHPSSNCTGWWQAEPSMGRMAHGVAAHVDRLKCLGNGQVPLVAATAFRLLRQRLDI